MDAAPGHMLALCYRDMCIEFYMCHMGCHSSPTLLVLLEIKGHSSFLASGFSTCWLLASHGPPLACHCPSRSRGFWQTTYT